MGANLIEPPDDGDSPKTDYGSEYWRIVRRAVQDEIEPFGYRVERLEAEHAAMKQRLHMGLPSAEAWIASTEESIRRANDEAG